MSTIQWSDWIPEGITVLSGKPPDTALATDDIARRLPASILELDLLEKFEGEEWSPSFKLFVRYCERAEHSKIIVPRFIPPPSPDQSEKLIAALELFGKTVILCTQPSQRRPIAGPRTLEERAAAVLSVRNGTLYDLQSGKSVIFQPKPKSCPEALWELLKDGPIPYPVANRKILQLGFAQQTFWNAVSEIARRETYLVPLEGVYQLDSEIDEVSDSRPAITSGEE